jgi:hypothetical protein
MDAIEPATAAVIGDLIETSTTHDKSFAAKVALDI